MTFISSAMPSRSTSSHWARSAASAFSAACSSCRVWKALPDLAEIACRWNGQKQPPMPLMSRVSSSTMK